MFNRRNFLLLSGSTITSLVLPGILLGRSVVAKAAAMNPADPDHFFILIRTTGGMDVTLGLDPQIHAPGIDQDDVFLEYGPDDIITSGGIRLAPAAAPLKPLAQDIAILNGLFMSSSDLGHQVGNLYAASGFTRTGPATFPFNLGFSLGSGPFGIATLGYSDSANLGIPSTNTQSILSGEIYDNNSTNFLAPIVQNENSDSPLAKSERALIQSSTVGAGVKAILDAYTQKGITLTDNHALAAAFAGGGARQAEVILDKQYNDIDSHVNHPKTHAAAQTQIWTQVADLLTIFKNLPYKTGSLFDHTTFMVVSEFSRTPALNQAKGKDHNNLTNSVLFAGRGLNTGAVYGKSMVISRKKSQDGNPVHIGMPYDFRAGAIAKAAENAQFIQPENVAATVAALFGNPDGFQYSAQAKPISGMVKGSGVI